ncbi:glycosyltransferase 87 family protein [Streptacidiphilus jiangxiensis]|uniref:glycosyltransferase 87 family protein n=1 Tax=Streptacidiphilus jiangxiensis TaxID=235985 RepID=UPI0009430CE3|nr:glycosyltransferase 87 family protein [Streptacidiphilus jiangxiensis]
MTTTHARSGEARRAAARLLLPRQRVEQFGAGLRGAGAAGDHRRAPWVLGALGCAGWAFGFPLISNLASQRAWGWSAGAGYVLAALVLALWPRGGAGDARGAARPIRLAVATALLGAVIVPLVLLLVQGQAQSEVFVVQQSAVRLVHTGSPYVPHPVNWTGYTPYLPGMTLFGFPHLVLPAVLGDARIWFLLAFLVCLVVSWRLLRGGPLAVPLAAVVASPLVALPAAVSGVDLPMIGGCILALALAGRGNAARAGIVLGLVCALKWTAWPAVPVALLLLLQVGGRRAALRGLLWTGLVGGALVVPFAVAFPQAMVEQVVRFPLGLSTVRTPAGSPLPGHILAELGPAGRTASLVLFGLSGLAVCVWLLVRPPRDARSACDRLALGVALAFLLAPAGRFGYLQLPVLLVLWPRLALRAERSSSPPVLVASGEDDVEEGSGQGAGVFPPVHHAEPDGSVHNESVDVPPAPDALPAPDAPDVAAIADEVRDLADLDLADQAGRAPSAAAR